MDPEQTEQVTVEIRSQGAVHKPYVAIKLLPLGQQEGYVHFMAGIDG
jgi:hypothetical protein